MAKVADFSAASARYVKAAVAKVNVDQSATLTKAEAAKLPKDLQDNYANFRAARGNTTVSVKDFTQSYAKYVAAAAKRADANGDGILSTSEAKALPADLRDNLANFELGNTAPVASGSLQTPAQIEDAVYNRQLPASNAFGKLARALDSQLADNNITTGVSGVASGKLENKNPSPAELKKWGTALMTAYLNDTDGTAPGKVTTSVMTPEKALKAAGLIIAEGNAFDLSNPDNVNELINGSGSGADRQIGFAEVVKKLGTPLNCLVIKTTTEDSNNPGEKSKVGMAIFQNTSTGQFVAFYGREGDM